VPKATFYNCRKRFAGLGVSEVRKMCPLREENTTLRQVVADPSFDKHMLQEKIAKTP
jgi:putative transposase